MKFRLKLRKFIHTSIYIYCQAFQRKLPRISEKSCVLLQAAQIALKSVYFTLKLKQKHKNTPDFAAFTINCVHSALKSGVFVL